MNKQIFSALVTADQLDGLKRASAACDVQWHRMVAQNEDPFSGQDELHDRLTAAWNEVADLDQEVRARIAAIFEKHGLGEHGFGGAVVTDYDPKKDNQSPRR